SSVHRSIRRQPGGQAHQAADLRLLRVLAIWCALASHATLNAGDLPSNGSFERGASTPEGWRLHHGASWAAGGHSGARSLSGGSKTEELICESEIFALKPGADYRLEGWVNCASGMARLGLDYLDEKGQRISQYVTSPASAAAGWRYVALEARSSGEALSPITD